MVHIHLAPVANGNGEAAPHLETNVLEPSRGATLSGTVSLDAEASANVKVTKVEFYLSGASQRETLIGSGRSTTVGWLAKWNTRTVPNGTYHLQSIANDAAGGSGHSESVTITVKN